MPKFITPAGNEVESNDPATVNDWRHRTGWTEVETSPKKKAAKKSASKPETETAPESA